jgi:cytochrome c biogenesis protein CcdA/thiol-disulfide isomerase/thioredoxin
MLLAFLAFLGGVLTILSPCILPVLPFAFARSDQPFARSTLPLLLGMALSFATVATLAAVGGGWAVQLNTTGRVVALVVLALFGLTLLWPRAAEAFARPFVAVGNRLVAKSGNDSASPVTRSVLLGVAMGFLWAPCAGPILGLILTGAALEGPSAQTTLLLFAYALGAVLSLALAVLVGGRVFEAMKRSLGAGEWIRRGLGVAVLAAVAAIALGWDTGALTRLSFNSTNRFEQALIDAFPAGTTESQEPAGMMMMSSAHTPSGLPSEGRLPPLDGATAWLNSPPLTPEGLRGKVVLVDFWTYSCINCLRAMPYVKAWHQRYKDHGLVVIGVHTPEFAFEKNEGNVRRAVEDLAVPYAVALDNDYAIWRAFNNRYWPAHYFIDADGEIRGHHFGEGNYDESERTIRELLTDAGWQDLPEPISAIEAAGVQSAADLGNVDSPETYLGYARAANFASAGGIVRDQAAGYAAPATLRRNQWALDGRWSVGAERAQVESRGGRITFRFRARDVHLVLAPAKAGERVRFRVTLDGAAPGDDHGVDVDAGGLGVVDTDRLYQLIRQSGEVRERTFSIEFLDAGARAYAFTFG